MPPGSEGIDGIPREPEGNATERYQWHKKVHVAWGKERLFFWRLGFSPTYNRERVEKLLREVFDDHQVCSYAVYELFGESDLLARVWLPTAVTQEDFETSLDHAFGREHLAHIHDFNVVRIPRHWVWYENGATRRPTEDRLLVPLRDEDIARINRGEAHPEELRQHELDNLVASARHSRGIRFATVVTPSSASGKGARDDQRDRILGVLDRAAHVVDISLYEGNGFGQYLILGRVDYRDYARIREEVTDPINEDVALSAHGARTYTMLIPGEDFLLFDEKLPLAEQVRDAEELTAHGALTAGEGQTVEVKGSAFVNLHRWLDGDGKLERDREVTCRGVLRAITGMLNAEGGTIVVGAVETDRFRDPRGRLEGLPRVGRFACIGIEVEDGADWDKYERRLSSMMGTAIQPNPKLWVTLTPETIHGVTVCRIVVREPDRDWYYLDCGDGPDFVVRFGGGTEGRDGPDADGYRRSRPRG